MSMLRALALYGQGGALGVHVEVVAAEVDVQIMHSTGWSKRETLEGARGACEVNVNLSNSPSH